MPEGVAQLEELGVTIAPHQRHPFVGIRYLDGELAADGDFADRPGLGIRRRVLHQALVERAVELGADLRWGVAALDLTVDGVASDDGEISARWVVGADGRASRVRRWAGLEGRPPRARRFGVRRHFGLPPWTDRVEVHWGDGCEAYVTPVAPDTVGVALLWSGTAAGFDDVLGRLPALAERVADAPVTSRDAGAGPFGSRARRLDRGHVVLVGDAACCLDPITGEGVAIALQSAEALVRSVVAGDLGHYRGVQRRLIGSAARVNQMVLLLERSPRLRARVVASLAARPDLFARFLAARRAPAASAAGAVVRLGWELLAVAR